MIKMFIRYFGKRQEHKPTDRKIFTHLSTLSTHARTHTQSKTFAQYCMKNIRQRNRHENTLRTMKKKSPLQTEAKEKTVNLSVLHLSCVFRFTVSHEKLRGDFRDISSVVTNRGGRRDESRGRLGRIAGGQFR